jgi:hypothetical protein
MSAPELRFAYTNWRGQRSLRTVTAPIGLTFASTKYRPEQQWLLDAYDVDKEERRTFALRDCDFSREGVAMAGVECSIDQLADHMMDRFDSIEGTLLECQAILRRLISAEAMEPATHKFETPPPWVDNQPTRWKDPSTEETP